MSAFLRLSLAERDFLVQGVEQGMRADGRSRHDFRSFEVESGVAPQTNGSCRLRCPQSNTDILVGVKLEIAEPRPDQPNEGYLQISVDCAAVASTVFQGRNTDDINDEMGQILQVTRVPPTCSSA
jgi:exosome complex component RRP42